MSSRRMAYIGIAAFFGVPFVLALVATLGSCAGSGSSLPASASAAAVVAVSAASGIGASVITQLTRVWLQHRRERREDAERRLEQRGQAAEDTGQVLVARMQADERTREQLWTWMQEQREIADEQRRRAEAAEARVAELHQQCVQLKHEHERCQRRLDRLEQHVAELRQTLMDEYGRAVRSSLPPKGDQQP